MLSVAVAATLVIAYGVVAKRLAARSVTGPMVFVGAGLLLGGPGGVLDIGLEEEGVRILVEATLALVLFVDAAGIDLRVVRARAQVPARLLLLGLPATVVLGTLAALALFDFGFWEAALLAAVLTPTDAALGQAVVTNTEVPTRVRQTLTIESGLNDGLALPLVTLFLGLAAEESGVIGGLSLVRFVSAQIGFGVLTGVAVGCLGGFVIARAVRTDTIDGLFRQLSTLAVAVCAFAIAELVGGNAFIAVFVAGMAFAQIARQAARHATDFAEDEGQLLTLLTFLVFGAAFARPALLSAPQPQTVLYAVLSLTVVRMVPVALSLAGTRLIAATRIFVGWFGPRGLASVLFAVLILEEADLAAQSDIVAVVSWTVLLSVYLHGITAQPLSRRYAQHMAQQSETALEQEPMPTMDP